MLLLLLLYTVDVNVNIFEKMFNINVNCTDYMHKSVVKPIIVYVVI